MQKKQTVAKRWSAGPEATLAAAVVLLERRCNQLERKLDQFIEDTSSIVEDLYDTIKCHKETDHG